MEETRGDYFAFCLFEVLNRGIELSVRRRGIFVGLVKLQHCSAFIK